MDTLLGFLALILSYGLVIVLVVKHVNYGLALFSGAIVLGVLFGIDLMGIASTLLMTASEPITYELVLAVSLIPIFAQAMIESKLIEELIDGLKMMLSQRAVLAIIPSVFGLFPMMGGALVSAPLINGEAEKLKVNSEKRSLINLWFRHMWFFISPLVTTLIVVGKVTNTNIYNIIVVDIPAFIVYVVLGYIFLIRPIKVSNVHISKSSFSYSFLKGIFPIALTIVTNVLGIHLIISLVLGIFSAILLGKANLSKVLEIFRKGFRWQLVASVIGALYFRNIIRYMHVDTFIVENAIAFGFPTLAFFSLIPLIFGFITAEPQTSAIMSASLVSDAFKTMLPEQVALLYISSFLAYFTSPLHLCLILTVEFFKSKIKEVFKWLIPLSILVYTIQFLFCYFLIEYV
ncbi:MAG: DUF401 family protein [Nitrososphaeria archaeon]|nr:DUF401 family protein [Nitrososphaeria archaeon]